MVGIRSELSTSKKRPGGRGVLGLPAPCREKPQFRLDKLKEGPGGVNGPKDSKNHKGGADWRPLFFIPSTGGNQKVGATGTPGAIREK